MLSVAVGSVSIPLRNLVQILAALPNLGNLPIDLQPLATILFALRIPRTVLVALTGAALAGSGASYQGLFRNPLADPYLIGVASGAGLGAVIAMTLHWSYSFWGLMAIPLAAFVGAGITVLAVYQLARVGNAVPTTNLILAGVTISAFTTALTSLLMITSSDEMVRAFTWLLGGSTLSGWRPVIAMLPYIVVGLGIQLAMGHALNVLQFGEEQAQQLGLSVQQIRLTVVAAASLTTAAAVSFAGIIGFVGLVVPHLVRMVWGADYRRLIPLAILNGASFLLVADIAARVVLSPQELPVGIVTALGGVPFFLWVLRRTRQQFF